MWAWVKEFFYQAFVILDQGLNVFPFFGQADETLSSRCFRMNHIPVYRFFEIVIDAGYRPFQGPNHCRNAYIKEVRGRQYPRGFFDKAVAMGIFPADPSRTGDLVELPK